MGVSRYQSIPTARRNAATTLRRVTEGADDLPTHRYNAGLANEIEHSWQDRWDAEHVFWSPNPTGLLAEDPRHLAGRPSRLRNFRSHSSWVPKSPWGRVSMRAMRRMA